MKRSFRVVAVLFLAFETWRFAVIGGSVLVPVWRNRAGPFVEGIAAQPPLAAVAGFAAAILAFLLPMALVIYALRVAQRRVSRFRTAVNRLG